MIDYRKGFLGLPSLLFWYGSVVPRCLLPATVSACLTVVFKYVPGCGFEEGCGFEDELPASAMGAISFIIGFLVIYRAQQGYMRYS